MLGAGIGLASNFASAFNWGSVDIGKIASLGLNAANVATNVASQIVSNEVSYERYLSDDNRDYDVANLGGLSGKNTFGTGTPKLVKGLLCTPSYNWVKVGNSLTASIDGLYVYAREPKNGYGGWGYFRFDFASACVQISSTNLIGKNMKEKKESATRVFNTAWNSTVKALDLALNIFSVGPNSPFKYPTIQFVRPWFKAAFVSSLRALSFNWNCSFSSGDECQGQGFQNISSPAKICDDL